MHNYYYIDTSTTTTNVNYNAIETTKNVHLGY